MPALKRLEALKRAPTSDEELARMRTAVRAEAQDRPGVYRMLSSDGEVVYVGKSKRVRSRSTGSTRRASSPRS
jgi:excinuclease ABC subunit C